MSVCWRGQPQLQEVDGRMGRDVPAIVVSHADRRRYREKVRSCMDVLARMLRDSRFPTGPEQVGLEVEFNLVDEAGSPAMCNSDVLAAINDPNWSPELGRFNIEVNMAPRLLAGDALATLEDLLADSYNRADTRARHRGARLAMIGILPSLREYHATEEAMSPNPRYQLLNEQICAARGEEMQISIEGPERLLTHMPSIMPEAACTSVQCHLQVSPELFGPYWNAAQAVAGVQVALAANSPYLFGRKPGSRCLCRPPTPGRKSCRRRGCGPGFGSANDGSPRCSTCSRRTCDTSRRSCRWSRTRTPSPNWTAGGSRSCPS